MKMTGDVIRLKNLFYFLIFFFLKSLLNRGDGDNLIDTKNLKK